jgi:hypothetical protein
LLRGIDGFEEAVLKEIGGVNGISLDKKIFFLDGTKKSRELLEINSLQIGN